MNSKKFKLFSEVDLSQTKSFSGLSKPWNLYAKNLKQAIPSLKLLRAFYKVPHQNCVIDFVGFRKAHELLFVWHCAELQWYTLSKLLPIFLRTEQQQKEIFKNLLPPEKVDLFYFTFILITEEINPSLFSCLKYFQTLPLEILLPKKDESGLLSYQLCPLKILANPLQKKEFEYLGLSDEERLDFMSLEEEMSLDEEEPLEEWENEIGSE